MARFDDLLTANRDYAAGYSSGGRPGQAARGLAVLTCMDSRLQPLTILGLERGDAAVLRNAGARVTEDVLRTLVVATHLLGVDRVLVMPHTDCAMSKASEQQVHERMAADGLDTRSLEFGMVADQAQRLADDVQRVRSWPFLPAGLDVAGALYDVATGRVEIVVPEA